MADDNYKKKVPEDDAEWEYPWNQVTQTLGGHEIFYNSTPDKESFREFHPSGPYRVITKDGHKVEIVANKKYSLASNGESKVCEGTQDLLTLGGRRFNNLGGDHMEIAMDATMGVHGQIIHAAKDTGFTFHKEKQITTTDGTTHDDNDGYTYNNAKQDKMCATNGNRVTVTDGENCSFNNSNWDTYIDKNARLASNGTMLISANNTWDAKSSQAMTLTSNNTFTANSKQDMTLNSQQSITTKAQQDITIEAQQTITIKVGQSSITISSNKIEIKSQQITIDGQSTTDVKGHPLNLNGGGMSSPPVTFP